MDKLFEKDLYLKILSIAFAAFLWFQVMGELNPLLPNVVRDVGIELTNLQSGTVVVNQQPATVTIKYSGSGRIARTDVRATVDLRNAQVGEGQFPVQVAVPQGFQLVEVTPSHVTITLDTLSSKQAPVAINLMGTVADDYATRSPLVQPADLRVEGPASKIALIARLIGEVDVTGATTSISRSVPVRAVDAANNEVRDVSIQPGVVSVMVPVVKLPPGKLVDVKAHLTGTPVAGKEVGTVTADPSSIKLRGDLAALAAITSVATQAVDVGGATATFTQEVPIIVPGAAQMAEPQVVRVTVEILSVQGSRTFEGVPVLVTDVRAGLAASVTPTGIRLVIRGPKDAISSLQPNDIKVQVSVSGLNPGTYHLKPNAILPPGYAVAEMAPTDVTVTLTGP